MELDVFRGLAILGIFMVNILVMNVSFAFRGEWEAEQTGALQTACFWVLETLFFGKFFTIFSLLFGAGVVLQMERFRQREKQYTSFFLRRFGSLFLFGVAHIVLLWAGDILHLYGMLGLILLAMSKLKARVWLWGAVVVFLFPFYGEIYAWVERALGVDHLAPLTALTRSEILELTHHGSYGSGVLLRLKEYVFASELIFAGIAPTALSMMLLGGYLVKRGMLQQLGTWLPRWKNPLLLTTLALLIYRFVLLFYLQPTFQPEHGSALSITLITGYLLSDIGISLTILWAVGSALQRDWGRKLLSPLQWVGRMAFTQYILQSVVGYLLMRTFNLYESLSPAECMATVVAIYAVQVLLSKWWLTRYRFGPLEWFWRCISYRTLLPFQKAE